MFLVSSRTEPLSGASHFAGNQAWTHLCIWATMHNAAAVLCCICPVLHLCCAAAVLCCICAVLCCICAVLQLCCALLLSLVRAVLCRAVSHVHCSLRKACKLIITPVAAGGWQHFISSATNRQTRKCYFPRTYLMTCYKGSIHVKCVPPCTFFLSPCAQIRHAAALGACLLCSA